MVSSFKAEWRRAIRLCRAPAAPSSSPSNLWLRGEIVDDRPIGVFDSGFGGLTVARALIDLLPDEDVVYFGGTARYPYGPPPLDDVRAYARQITEVLVERHDVQMIV